MSDDSDSGPKHKRKRTNRLTDSPSASSSSAGSSVVTTSRRRQRRRYIEDDSDSDSGSSIELRPKRKAVPRVASDADSDSSGSVIIQRSKRPARVVSDTESSEDSDHGFEGSSSSQWETDISDTEAPKSTTAKVQDTGVDSDSSDGQSEKCPICLISFSNQEVGSPEACDHLFCVECIQEWSKNMNTCPVDRQEYNIILVRRNINGGIYKQIPVQAPSPPNEIDIVEDPTFCEVCGRSDREDRMLLCDGCDLGFHLECLTPPLDDIPPGAWFCNDCSPEDVIDPEIELFELQLLLDDANDLGRPRNSRRTTTSRLIPRTRQSERVRRQIQTNRSINQPSTASEEPSHQVSSSTSRPHRRSKKKTKKRRRNRYKVVYQVDETTGETIPVKKRVRKRRSRKRRPVPRPKTAKKRLALQLRMCAPSNVPQHLPETRSTPQVSSLQTQRLQAGIPTLSLFGSPNELDVWSEGEGDDGFGVMIRRPSTRRRALIKSVGPPNPVSSSTDVLGSILDVQARFHSKSTKFSLGRDGRITMETSDRVLRELNNFDHLVRTAPTADSNDNRRDSVPSSSGQSSTTPERNSSPPSSTVENSTAAANFTGSAQERNSPEDCTASNLCAVYDVNMGDRRDKKAEETSENNTPRSSTPASESEIDIYSDIETVSTSKLDDGDIKAPSPLPPTPNAGSDDDNDSESDMVIDTEKTNPEPEENTKEETTVTSTVDSNAEVPPPPQAVTSSSEIQSQAIQSSNELFDDQKKNTEKERDDDEDSEDGCPNFSIYSKESITMAKNTDITLGEIQENDQVGEVSSSPAENPEQQPEEKIVERPIMGTGLYSDSEDESIVKKGVENSFGLGDIRNMTEDISEEERSYTPCLDERPHFRQGIEGLDTEMISDEDRNDFDESHELKTASDGDALEINAKESELDFTRPEDYEEGEIVDKLKNKIAEESKNGKEDTKNVAKTKPETSNVGNKENENQNGNKESSFKKISKNNKERNYRDKDKERERSKSREKKDRDRDRDKDKRDKKKEKRKEIERYDVRALIAEKPRRLKDKFGRDISRRSRSRTRSKTPASPARRSASRGRRSASRRSGSRRRSVSRRKSLSRDRNRNKRRRSKNRRSASRSKSRSVDRRRSRSKTKKRKRSVSRDRRKKSRSRSKGKTKKQRNRSRQRSRSISPKKAREWSRRHSREWTPSLSRSRSPPDQRQLTPSWTPPRMMDNTVKPHNLTVILTNDANKKKKEKKKKTDKKTKENERGKKRRRSERTPQPSKEVFASGDNILVSVSFNKDNETRDVSTKKKKEEELVKKKKDKVKKKKRSRDLTGVKPVAIIDLERSPFKELTPSPKDVIVLSDSDNEETRNLQKGVCDSSQQVASPERLINNYATGPKTPPEPQVKFTLTKQTQLRAISNPLHEPDDIEPEGDAQESVDGSHKGPNTPPEPPNSPPSSPDAYDPFEPTKSRSPTPEPMQTTQSNSTLNLEDNRDDSIMETRSEIEISNISVQPTDVSKSMTPPLADIQPADSQSSIQVTPESSLGKSPERTSSAPIQTQTVTPSKPVAQTIPFSSSVPTSLMSSTPVSTSLAPPRINILNTTIIAPTSIPQRIVLPNTVKSSPLKISPTKPPIKSTPIKPMPSKAARKSTNRNQNGSDNVEQNLGLDSPYSPGSSDYEDLFEPPVEAAPKQVSKTANKNTKSPTKIQNVFDSLFETPFNKVKTKSDKSGGKFNNKKSSAGKGTKQVGVKLDEDNLKILDELPNSAVEMQVKDKFLKKLNRQERVVEEVKLVLKPHYNKKHINKDEYKDILRRAVPKICHNKSGEINPTKIKNLIEAYVKRVRHSKKVTSSSSSVNPQKA